MSRHSIRKIVDIYCSPELQRTLLDCQLDQQYTTFRRFGLLQAGDNTTCCLVLQHGTPAWMEENHGSH